MSLIKDPSKVHDSEITLEDVRRAEEIIKRANALLGRKTDCSCVHYYWPYTVYTNAYTWPQYTVTSTTLGGTTAGRMAVNNQSTGILLSANTSIVDAAKMVTG